jgi:hypothetical protein
MHELPSLSQNSGWQAAAWILIALHKPFALVPERHQSKRNLVLIIEH